MAVTYLPFFLVIHGWNKLQGQEVAGFEPSYHFAVGFSSVVYACLGLIFLRKVLLRFFSDPIAAIVLFAMTAGTNLFYYSTSGPGLSHIPCFFLFAVFIWFTIRYYESLLTRHLVFIATAGAFLVLIRPVNILVFLIFFLYGITSWHALKLRMIGYVSTNKKVILLFFLLGVAIFLPQLIYWKMQTGSWFFNSYIGERFYFSDPHLLDGFFSYRKGLFVYTPMMLLCVAGFYFLFRNYREWALPVLLFFILNAYVLFSWWCWWYGGSFGQRSWIDSYPLFAISLGAMLQYFFQRERWKFIAVFSLVILVSLFTIFDTMKYRYLSIHHDSMTKEAYWDSFLRLKKSEKFDDLLREPEYEKARMGIPE